MIESGVIELGDKQDESKCTLVYGKMNEPPGARACVGLTGLTVAEYFHDAEGQDVLLFIDNIFRFTQANFELLRITTPNINESRRKLKTHSKSHSLRDLAAEARERGERSLPSWRAPVVTSDPTGTTLSERAKQLQLFQNLTPQHGKPKRQRTWRRGTAWTKKTRNRRAMVENTV
ncbi:hypothetical protein IEQ34_003872 [Dendrobium chrysotoxum]|uniref:ATP synthase subunit beta, mitochondrial n=1 Tax=Dendrobium chrysotoxum TaxID=161865 RepID=A0AAV7GYN1_DENCH|nr:hypothetical protein IEQ34_003872 [Dendrobium chrysotoxum]